MKSKRSELRISTLLVIFIFTLCTQSLAQWPRFHGNSLNTGAVLGAQGRSGNYTTMWTFPISSYTNSSPALADIDEDGLLEVVIAANLEALYALNGEDGSLLWSYSLVDTGNNGAPVINDLDGDLKSEIVFATNDSLIVLEGETGTLIWSEPIEGGIGRSASTGDLDGDGIPEVIYAGSDSIRAYDGETGSVLWAVSGYWVSDYGSAVAEDTDLDGSAEVLVCSADGEYFCLLDGTDGSLIWQTPIATSTWGPTPAPAFADLDLDGYPEIVSCAGDDDLYVMNADDGSVKWSVQLPGYPHSSPCLLDLDGNDSLEIVVGVYFEKQLRAYTCTGDSIWTASVPNLPLGTPAVADIDGDQALEIIQTSAYPAGAVQINDAATGALEWLHGYGGYFVGSSPAIGDLDDDGFYDFVFGCHDGYIYAYNVTPQGIEQQSNLNPVNATVAPNPFTSNISITIELPEPGHVSITVFDLSGRCICSLEQAELGSGNHVYVWDGTNHTGETVSSGLYICRIQYGGMIETIDLCRLK